MDEHGNDHFLQLLQPKQVKLKPCQSWFKRPPTQVFFLKTVKKLAEEPDEPSVSCIKSQIALNEIFQLEFFAAYVKSFLGPKLP